MKFKRKFLTKLFACMLGMGLVAASCGGESSSESSDETEVVDETEAGEGEEVDESPEPEAPDSGEVVTIRWFMRWDEARVENVAKPVIAEFEAANPNIKVEFENVGSGDEYYQKLQTSIAGDVAPDVFYPATHFAYALGSKGAIEPIDKLAESSGLDLAGFDQGVLELYQIDGQQMCLPIDTAALVVFYNKEIFDELGVAYPEPDWTWDDFLETAKAVTSDADGDGAADVFGVEQFVNYWPLLVWSNTGHNVFDDQRNPTEFLINDEASIESIQWVADLSVKHGVMPDDSARADIGDMFAAEKAAMNIVGHWRVPRYTNEADFEFDVAPLPTGPTGPLNRADGSCFALSSSSEHPEEAWQFIEFLAGPNSAGVDTLLELQQMVPVITEFQDSEAFLNPPGLEDVNKEAFLAGSDNLFSMYDPLHPVYAEWDALWKQEFGEVWLGNTTAKEAVEFMTPEVEDMLANLEDYE